VRLGGRVLVAEGDNKPIEGNGGAVFLLLRGTEWQNSTMGMAIVEVAGTEGYIRGLIFDSYVNYHHEPNLIMMLIIRYHQ